MARSSRCVQEGKERASGHAGPPRASGRRERAGAWGRPVGRALGGSEEGPQGPAGGPQGGEFGRHSLRQKVRVASLPGEAVRPGGRRAGSRRGGRDRETPQPQNLRSIFKAAAVLGGGGGGEGRAADGGHLCGVAVVTARGGRAQRPRGREDPEQECFVAAHRRAAGTRWPRA